MSPFPRVTVLVVLVDLLLAGLVLWYLQSGPPEPAPEPPPAPSRPPEKGDILLFPPNETGQGKGSPGKEVEGFLSGPRPLFGPAVGRTSATTLAEAGAPPPGGDATHRLFGTLRRTGTDLPLDRAIVVLDHPGWPQPLGLLTDTRGRYAFEDLEPGDYGLSVEAAGYALVLDRPVEVPPLGDRMLDLGLVPGAPVLGRVLLAGTSEGLGGARVVVTGAGPLGATSGLLGLEARTGPDGGFRLDGLPLGEPVDLMFDDPRHAVRRLSGIEPGAELEVELEWGLALDGRVLDREGRPVPGAQVQAVTAAGYGRMAGTNAEGRFHLQGLAGRPDYLLVQAEGHPGIARRLLPARPAGPLDLVLPNGGRLGFRLPASSGAPDEVTVVAVDHGVVVCKAAAPRGPDGAYLSEVLPADVAGLYLQAPGRAPLRLAEGVVRPGEIAELGELRPPSGAAVRGRLENEQGRPVAGAPVALYSLESGNELHKALHAPAVFSGEDGAFSIPGAPPGRFRVEAIRPLPRAVAYTRVEVAGDAPPPAVVIRFRPAGTQPGRLLLAGRPLAGAVVRTEFPDLLRESITGDDGGFAFQHLPAGDYEFSVLHPGRGSSVFLVARARVASGDNPPLVLELPPGPGWTGRVLADGAPLPDTVLEAAQDRGDRLVGALATSDAQGNFHLPFLAPGPYRLRVERPGRPPLELQLELPATGRRDLFLER